MKSKSNGNPKTAWTKLSSKKQRGPKINGDTDKLVVLVPFALADFLGITKLIAIEFPFSRPKMANLMSVGLYKRIQNQCEPIEVIDNCYHLIRIQC